MPVNYKIEILFQTNISEFFWCIIEINPYASYNIGHGTASSYLKAVQKAYDYFEKYITTKNN